MTPLARYLNVYVLLALPLFLAGCFAPDPVQPAPVPWCHPPMAHYHWSGLDTEDVRATAQLLYDRNWTNVMVDDSFLGPGTVDADCQ